MIWFEFKFNFFEGYLPSFTQDLVKAYFEVFFPLFISIFPRLISGNDRTSKSNLVWILPKSRIE
jgi:hypothetical protein